MTFRDIRSDQKYTELLVENVKSSQGNWQKLPHHVFGDIMKIMGRERPENLQKCRQVSQRWNVMMSQMTLINKYIVRTIGQWDRGSDRHTYTGM